MKYHYFPILVLVALHAVFLPLGIYEIPHIDSLMHLAGGVALGMFVYGALIGAMRRGWCHYIGTRLVPVLVVSLVAMGAVCWEFYEWLSDALFDTRLQASVTDTMKDLFLGLLGGVFYAVYAGVVYVGDRVSHVVHDSK